MPRPVSHRRGGGLPDGSRFADVEGLENALLRRPELFVGTVAEKLLIYASGRGLELRRAGDPYPAGRPREGLPLVVDSSRSREEPAVSDEDVAMIITRKALPRRTFLRGLGATVGSPAPRRHGAVDDGVRPIRGRAGPAPGIRLHADGLRPLEVDAGGEAGPGWSCRRRSSRSRRSWISSRSSRTSSSRTRTGHPCDLERRVPERGHPRSGPRARTTTSARRSIRLQRRRSVTRRCCPRSSCRWTSFRP